MKKSYELIVFDWDGTLMDSSEKIVKCFEGAAKDTGVSLPDAEEVKSYIGIGLVEAFGRLYPNQGRETIYQLVSRYRQYWLHIDQTPMPMFAGVEQGLNQLNNAGYLLAIATGKSRSGLDRVLKTTGLENLFAWF